MPIDTCDSNNCVCRPLVSNHTDGEACSKARMRLQSDKPKRGSELAFGQVSTLASSRTSLTAFSFPHRPPLRVWSPLRVLHGADSLYCIAAVQPAKALAPDVKSSNELARAGGPLPQRLSPAMVRRSGIDYACRFGHRPMLQHVPQPCMWLS